MAASHWEMVVEVPGKTKLTVIWPETKASPEYYPSGVEHFGIYLNTACDDIFQAIP
jgi:hypothetical protein